MRHPRQRCTGGVPLARRDSRPVHVITFREIPVIRTTEPVTATLLLASAAGARSMAGVAAMTRAFAIDEGLSDVAALPHALASPRAQGVTALLAAGELIGDKLPNIPNRTDLLPLLGRVGAGALIGAAVSDATGRDRLTGALVGGATALLAAELSYLARRELSRVLPAFVAAAVEDAAVMWLAAEGARRLASPGAPAAA